MLAIAGRVLDWVTAAIAALLKASLVTAVVIMLACIVLQVVMRYIVGQALSWSEELALLMFAWATLGGLALGVREGFHVRLDVFLGALPNSLRSWGVRVIEAFTAFFGAYLAWSGARFFSMTRGSVSAAIGYPIEVLHSLAMATGVLICLFALHRVVRGPAAAAPDRAQGLTS